MISTEFVDCRTWRPALWWTWKPRTLSAGAGGNAIHISGHPEVSDGRSFRDRRTRRIIEPGLIGRGMHLRFMVDDRRPVTTSRVVRYA